MSDQNNADNGAQAQQEAGEQSQQAQHANQNAAQGTDNGAQAQQAQQSTQTQSTPPAGSTVSRHKHERDIAKLEAERDAAKAEAEGYKKLEAEFEAWKASQEAEKSEKALKDAGCIDTVAASARLNEFDGDITKLKEAAPYLFASSDKSKKTGGNPKGNPDPEDERTKNMREYMGLEPDKE